MLAISFFAGTCAMSESPGKAEEPLRVILVPIDGHFDAPLPIGIPYPPNYGIKLSQFADHLQEATPQSS